MKSTGTLFGLFVVLLAIGLASAGYDSIKEECKKAEATGEGECSAGPFCTGYSGLKAEEISNTCENVKDFGVGACQVFYSVTKVGTNKFKVTVVGPAPKGWVGIGFPTGDDEDATTPGVVCFAEGTKGMVATDLKTAPAFAEDSGTKTISGYKVEIDGDWLTCEFQLDTKEGPFDLETNHRRIYLAWANKGKDGAPEFQGSSKETQDFWTILTEPKAADSGVSPLPPRKAILLIVIAAAAYTLATRQ